MCTRMTEWRRKWQSQSSRRNYGSSPCGAASSQSRTDSGGGDHIDARRNTTVFRGLFSLSGFKRARGRASRLLSLPLIAASPLDVTLQFSFPQEDLGCLLRLCSSICAEPLWRHLIVESWCAPPFGEQALVFLLPASLYNNAFLRSVLRIIFDVCFPFLIWMVVIIKGKAFMEFFFFLIILINHNTILFFGVFCHILTISSPDRIYDVEFRLTAAIFPSQIRVAAATETAAGASEKAEKRGKLSTRGRQSGSTIGQLGKSTMAIQSFNWRRGKSTSRSSWGYLG